MALFFSVLEKASRGRSLAESFWERCKAGESRKRACVGAGGFGGESDLRMKNPGPVSWPRVLHVFVVCSTPCVSTLSNARCAVVSGILNLG